MKITKNPGLYIPIIAIVILSQVVYLNTLSNQFVYDDEFTIVNNYFIKTWHNLPSLFNRDYFKYAGELSYRPVVTLSYFIDYALWQLNPFGFHLINSVLHTLNSILLFSLLLRVFHCLTVSFIATLVFSCHPVISETVNAISYREDLLAATFFISAFIMYLKSSTDKPVLSMPPDPPEIPKDKIYKYKQSFTPAYYASLICYLMGLFSKEMAITLPLIIFLYDIVATKTTSPGYKFFRYYIGYILATLFYLSIRFVVLHNPIESHVSYPLDSIPTNLMTMTKVLTSYVKLLFFPVNLCADYVMPYSQSPLDISFILSFFLLSSVIVIAYRLFFYSKILFFSILWFFVTLLPVLNVIPIENIMAERYLYLSAIGFCILCGKLLAGYSDKIDFLKKHIIAITLLIIILASFSVKTIKRNGVWKDQTILWTNTANTSPQSYKAHNNLGNIYRDSGRLDEAVFEFKYALKVYDDYIDAHNNLGVTYRKKGMIQEALAEYQKALKLNPRYPYAHNNLGVLYAKLNNLDLSITEFKNAISHKPDYPDAHNNLGASYIRQGLYERAISECLEAVKYNNHYTDAYYNLSTAYLNNNQLDKALETARIILSINPNYHELRELIGLICEQKEIKGKR